MSLITGDKFTSPLFFLSLSHIDFHWQNLIGVQLTSELRIYSFQASTISILSSRAKKGWDRGWQQRHKLLTLSTFLAIQHPFLSYYSYLISIQGSASMWSNVHISFIKLMLFLHLNHWIIPPEYSICCKLNDKVTFHKSSLNKEMGEEGGVKLVHIHKYISLKNKKEKYL